MGGFDHDESTVRLRSIYVSTAVSPDDEAESQHNGSADGGWEQAPPPQARAEDVDDTKNENSDDDEFGDLDASEPEPLQLPESTHTLFYTQPICSIPWLFALAIAVISITSLVMALVNNLQDSDIPANVTIAVRIAQYLAIFIALLMEEEIPTGLHLLRMVPRHAFKKRFPSKSYSRFVCSALLRIFLGYLFLVNVGLILGQATGVLDIFYDVLALQFISELDDIGFSLAKIDVLGKKLQRACTARLFQTEFQKQEFGRSKRASIFLKSIYFFNLAAFLAGMVVISTRQEMGYYQCNEITVDFGDAVWEDALVGDEETILVFSTFNGVYVKNGTYAGRPVYREMRKVDQKHFDQEFVIPAEIRYDRSLSSWIFEHPNIRKSEKEEEPWLLRSQETTEYDLLNVEGQWSIWVSRIETTTVTITCNKCNENTDCNLNGICNDDGKCECDSNEKTSYIGTHCEVKLKKECGTIVSELSNASFSIQLFPDEETGELRVFEEYNRPVYSHVEGKPNHTEGDIDWLVYTGRRWIYVGFNPVEENVSYWDVVAATWNYHAFWSDRFSFASESLLYLSDPTTGDNPVGVDWYLIGERGSQFGPFGALYPMQKDGQVGRGIFRCAGPMHVPPTDTNATSVRMLQSHKP